MGRKGGTTSHKRPFTSGALLPGTALHGHGTRDVWLNGVVKDVGGAGFMNTMFAPGKKSALELESPPKGEQKTIRFSAFQGSVPDDWGLARTGLRPSTWGSDKRDIASRGRTVDGHFTTCMPNGDGGRVFIDPKVRYVDTPGAIYNQMPLRGHVQTCRFSKQGARFPKQKPALDPPMNIGDVKRKRVIGGCFSKDTRFRLMERNISSGASVGIRSERSDTSTRPTSSKESYVLSRASARNPKRRMQNSRDILWPPEASPVFAPLRMIGVNARTPGLRGRAPALTRTTSLTHSAGKYSAVESGGIL